MEPQITEENRMKKSGRGVLIAVGVVVLILTMLGVVVFNQKNSQPAGQLPGDSVGTTDEQNGVPPEGSDTPSMSEDTPLVPDNDSPEGNIQTPSIGVTSYTAYMGFTENFEGATEPVADEIDEVVIGYEWEAIFPSPLFATISLPAWDSDTNTLYPIEVWNEDTSEYDVLGDFPAGEEITFPREGFLGARKFKVLGIDPDLRVCPGDRSFTWDAKFTFDGEHGLIRTPITEPLPAGETCELQ